jgi:hypothetical protein
MALRWGRVSGAIYGTLAVAVLLAVESADGHTYATTLGAAVLTLVAYWLAHGYARALAARLTSDAAGSGGRLLRSLGQESGILVGGSIPLVALMMCWLARVDLARALEIGVWAGAAALFAVELIAGVRARSRVRTLLQDGALSLAVGALVVLVRVLLH